MNWETLHPNYCRQETRRDKYQPLLWGKTKVFTADHVIKWKLHVKLPQILTFTKRKPCLIEAARYKVRTTTGWLCIVLMCGSAIAINWWGPLIELMKAIWVSALQYLTVTRKVKFKIWSHDTTLIKLPIWMKKNGINK